MTSAALRRRYHIDIVISHRDIRHHFEPRRRVQHRRIDTVRDETQHALLVHHRLP